MLQTACKGILYGTGRQMVGMVLLFVSYYMLALPMGIPLMFLTDLRTAGEPKVSLHDYCCIQSAAVPKDNKAVYLFIYSHDFVYVSLLAISDYMLSQDTGQQQHLLFNNGSIV